MPRDEPDAAVNFYATPEEIAEWAREWIRRYGLHYVFARNFPDKALTQDVPWDDLPVVAQLVQSYGFGLLHLRLEPIDVSVPSINHLPAVNRDMLTIVPPHATPDGFEYGWLGSVAHAQEPLRVYRAITDDLIARTESGMWIALRGRKKPTFEKHLRYSPGASQLWQRGTPLLVGGSGRVTRLGVVAGS